MCESHNSQMISETNKLRQQTQEINNRIEANRRVFAEEASKAEKMLADLSANVKLYHKTLFNYIPIEFNDDDDNNNDDDINIDGGNVNDDNGEFEEDDDDNGNRYGGLRFRTGNEGNIGSTSEDERDDIYI